MVEVGMVIRTNQGIIAKLIDKEIEEKGNIFIFDKALYSVECEYDSTEHIKELTDFESYMSHQGTIDIITKASFNLIDLIEVGDVISVRIHGDISKYEVEQFDLKGEIIGIRVQILEDIRIFELKDLDIISILTKEQFKANEYVVKE